MWVDKNVRVFRWSKLLELLENLHGHMYRLSFTDACAALGIDQPTNYLFACNCTCSLKAAEEETKTIDEEAIDEETIDEETIDGRTIDEGSRIALARASKKRRERKSPRQIKNGGGLLAMRSNTDADKPWSGAAQNFKKERDKQHEIRSGATGHKTGPMSLDAQRNHTHRLPEPCKCSHRRSDCAMRGNGAEEEREKDSIEMHGKTPLRDEKGAMTPILLGVSASCVGLSHITLCAKETKYKNRENGRRMGMQDRNNERKHARGPPSARICANTETGVKREETVSLPGNYISRSRLKIHVTTDSPYTAKNK
ncbi:hypothetical protein C8J57DRAFT_1239676 [Mycena rebaudengoi]|nr:hypothetical protein C8J57DRAFT_1239676 [Mycena rebaudengoi]